MSDVTVAEKTCRTCGKTKPLSGFYRLSSSPDGRMSRCGACELAYQREYQAKLRDRIGEEAWLERRRRYVRKHRELGRDESARLSKKAYDAALYDLRDRHRSEFDALLHQHRYDLGLEVS